MFDPKTLDDAYSLAKLQEFTLSKSESSSRVDKVELVIEEKRLETIEENVDYKVYDEMPRPNLERENLNKRQDVYCKLIRTTKISFEEVKKAEIYEVVQEDIWHLFEEHTNVDDSLITNKNVGGMEQDVNDSLIKDNNVVRAEHVTMIANNFSKQNIHAIIRGFEDVKLGKEPSHSNIVESIENLEPEWMRQLEYTSHSYKIPPKPPDNILLCNFNEVLVNCNEFKPRAENKDESNVNRKGYDNNRLASYWLEASIWGTALKGLNQPEEAELLLDKVMRGLVHGVSKIMKDIVTEVVWAATRDEFKITSTK